jgi:hypothetical protein|tara:strand:- start:297 stop:575 length:279 start_codon:yes stop_codon:yes gene_type:complete
VEQEFRGEKMSKDGKLRITDRIYLHPTFRELYDRLSEKQRQAVDLHVQQMGGHLQSTRDKLRASLQEKDKVQNFVKSLDEAMFLSAKKKGDS